MLRFVFVYDARFADALPTMFNDSSSFDTTERFQNLKTIS